jgi:hypothetical protein
MGESQINAPSNVTHSLEQAGDFGSSGNNNNIIINHCQCYKYRLRRYEYLGITGGAVGLLALATSIGLYSLSTPYSVVRQPLSDLGWGPNGSGVVYRGGFLFAACLLAPFIWLLTRYVRRAVASAGDNNNNGSSNSNRKARLLPIAIEVCLACGIIALAAVFGILWFYDQNASTFYVHDACAVSFVTFHTIMMGGYTLIMWVVGLSSRAQVAITACELVAALATAAFVIPLLQTYDIAELLSQLMTMASDERAAATRRISSIAWWFPLTEFCVLILILAWHVVTAVVALDNGEQQRQQDISSSSDTNRAAVADKESSASTRHENDLVEGASKRLA